MPTLMDKQGKESVTTCQGCGMHRLCREYEGLWLCLSGPAKCWKRRKMVKARKVSEARKDGGRGA